MSPGLIGPAGIAVCVQVIGEQAPAVGGTGLQLHGTAQGRDRVAKTACLGPGDAELQMHGRGLRLLQGERLEYVESRLRPPGTPVRRA